MRPASQRAGLPNAMRCDRCGGGPDACVGGLWSDQLRSRLRGVRRTHASAICHGPRRRGVLKWETDYWIWSQRWSTNGVASSTSTGSLRLKKMAIKNGVRTLVRRSAVITVTATYPNRRTPPTSVANPYAREEIEAHLERVTLPRLSQSGTAGFSFPIDHPWEYRWCRCIVRPIVRPCMGES